MKKFTAGKRTAIVVIGNEVLCGDIDEVNSTFLARQITSLGSTVEKIIVLPDDEDTIVSELSELSKEYDAVLATGGIGATHDDVTRQSAARVFGRPLSVNKEALDLLRSHFGQKINAQREKLAELPTPCRLIPNPVGVAPGFIVENVYVFPGVPQMLKSMFPFVADDFTGPTLHHNAVFSDLPESFFACPLAEIAAGNPEVTIGSYPLPPGEKHSVRIVIKSRDKNKVVRVSGDIELMLSNLKEIGSHLKY